MARVAALFLVLFIVLVPVSLAEVHEVTYFYENYCESCSPEDEFANTFYELTGLQLFDCHFEAYNIVTAAGQKAYDDACSKMELETSNLPVVIVDGIVYSGESQLNQALPEAALNWGIETDSVIIYLYTPACESCARTEQILDSLPQSISIKRGNLTITSDVLVQRIDASAQSDLAMVLFEQYDVPDERRITPIAFFADHYLSGAEAIEQRLAAMISMGWAVGGIDLAFKTATYSEPDFSLAATLGAGLAAGLNGCALSMLLLFLSLILEGRSHSGLLAACFLGAKFVCYLLIGWVLLSMLQQLNPRWVQPTARIVLTGMGSVLIMLNIWDAFQAHRLQLGKIRNQLPSRLRGGLRRAIHALTRKSILIPSVIALGFLIAIGEFLCSGQLYLMRILSALHSEENAGMMTLILYCIAFIAPSVVLTILVFRGKSHRRISGFLADHLMMTKLISATVMLLLILLAWLI